MSGIVSQEHVRSSYIGCTDFWRLIVTDTQTHRHTDRHSDRVGPRDAYASKKTYMEKGGKVQDWKNVGKNRTGKLEPWKMTTLDNDRRENDRP